MSLFKYTFGYFIIYNLVLVFERSSFGESGDVPERLCSTPGFNSPEEMGLNIGCLHPSKGTCHLV